MFWYWWRARKSVLKCATESSTIKLRVLPTDLDVFNHMNNSRYLSMMDLGRLDLITRMGLTPLMYSKKWFPLVAKVQVQYKKPLNLFERYELTTRIVDLDEKWFYIEQVFSKGDDLIARGWLKGIVRGPKGNIPTQTVLDELRLPVGEVDVSEEFKNWMQLKQ
jgi:acyl-CoA thioesterase FadM